jgi:hypothetical protein
MKSETQSVANTFVILGSRCKVAINAMKYSARHNMNPTAILRDASHFHKRESDDGARISYSYISRDEN